MLLIEQSYRNTIESDVVRRLSGDSGNLEGTGRHIRLLPATVATPRRLSGHDSCCTSVPLPRVVFKKTLDRRWSEFDEPCSCDSDFNSKKSTSWVKCLLRAGFSLCFSIF